MNTANPIPKDEAGCDDFDRLVRNALQALVSNQTPPERVWKQVKARLEKGQGPPHRFQTPWLPMLIQPALVLLLLGLGGVALNSPCAVSQPKMGNASAAVLTSATANQPVAGSSTF